MRLVYLLCFKFLNIVQSIIQLERRGTRKLEFSYFSYGSLKIFDFSGIWNLYIIDKGENSVEFWIDILCNNFFESTTMYQS